SSIISGAARSQSNIHSLQKGPTQTSSVPAPSSRNCSMKRTSSEARRRRRSARDLTAPNRDLIRAALHASPATGLPIVDGCPADGQSFLPALALGCESTYHPFQRLLEWASRKPPKGSVERGGCPPSRKGPVSRSHLMVHLSRPRCWRHGADSDLSDLRRARRPDPAERGDSRDLPQRHVS